MKATAFVAILAVLAMAIAPLWTVNATADDVMEPISVDVMEPISVDRANWDYYMYGNANGNFVLGGRGMRLQFYSGDNEINGADWDYRVYEDANGNSVSGGRGMRLQFYGDDNEINGADWDYRVYEDANGNFVSGGRGMRLQFCGDDNEINGADWDYRVYGNANGNCVYVDRNNEVHSGDGWWGLCFGAETNNTLFDESKGFSSIIRSIHGGDDMMAFQSIIQNIRSVLTPEQEAKLVALGILE